MCFLGSLFEGGYACICICVILCHMGFGFLLVNSGMQWKGRITSELRPKNTCRLCLVFSRLALRILPIRMVKLIRKYYDIQRNVICRHSTSAKLLLSNQHQLPVVWLSYQGCLVLSELSPCFSAWYHLFAIT